MVRSRGRRRIQPARSAPARGGANRRYLAFLSSLDDPTIAFETVARLSEKTEDAGRSYRGFNFFSARDLDLFETILRGENTIAGFRTCGCTTSSGRSGAPTSTTSRSEAITMGLKLKELVLIPELARALA